MKCVWIGRLNQVALVSALALGAHAMAADRVVLDGSTGVMPLASALAKAFQARNPGVAFEYGKGLGTRARFQALAEGHVDFVVSSARAAEANLSKQLAIVHNLGPGSYYAEGSVVVLSHETLSDPSRAATVAVDARSNDSRTLTELEFPDAKHVDVPWIDIPDAIWAGTVEAAVGDRHARDLTDQGCAPSG